VTSFVLLTRQDSSKQWTEAGILEAHSAAQAMRDGYLRLPNKSNVVAVVAVPVRSFRPTPIRTETVTKVVLGDDSGPPPSKPDAETHDTGKP
jgi:hypothetical protein